MSLCTLKKDYSKKSKFKKIIPPKTPKIFTEKFWEFWTIPTAKMSLLVKKSRKSRNKPLVWSKLKSP